MKMWIKIVTLTNKKIVTQCTIVLYPLLSYTYELNAYMTSFGYSFDFFFRACALLFKNLSCNSYSYLSTLGCSLLTCMNLHDFFELS